MAPRDSLSTNHKPNQAADPLIALARLLARQAAAEALRDEKSGEEATVVGAAVAGAGATDEARGANTADVTKASAPAGGSRG